MGCVRNALKSRRFGKSYVCFAGKMPILVLMLLERGKGCARLIKCLISKIQNSQIMVDVVCVGYSDCLWAACEML